ncbi:adenylate kinase [Galdieria sulphuraria]|uniref:Adenylate kinase n=1 Tax=Galdieria sulphuraria TaxID=130081 RepID=M2XUN9_GALSU|nr:adenylate kinase [Galdieria sulphuraria]EME27338.1 adenylate kinase [Galdieria sulphuraria]|eukprot:XP_005703858.1 adenylate kinase [Galdieria sulphuraria]
MENVQVWTMRHWQSELNMTWLCFISLIPTPFRYFGSKRSLKRPFRYLDNSCCSCCESIDKEQQVKRIVLIGKPCSGKGTQAPLLSSRYGFVHLSTGQILREEMNKNTSLGALAAQYMKQGDMLPDSIMLPLISSRIAQQDCQNKGYILDGFPRTISQALKMSSHHIGVDIVFLLQRSDEDAIEWMRERLYDPLTGILYHPTYYPPPPDSIPFLQRRIDDNEIVMRKRLFQFHQSCLPIIQLFQVSFCHFMQWWGSYMEE